VLRKPPHFSRFVGARVWLELQLPRDGRRRFTGTLVRVTDIGVELEVDGAPVQVAFTEIGKARLVA
jgi:ribosome maturation factor RimP